jgi:hypothetical protein
MPTPTDIHGTVFTSGTVTLLARIVGHDGANIVRAGVASIRYSIYVLDDDDPDARTPVPGHDNVALAVADVLSDGLVTDALWTADAAGYNFRHTPDVSGQPAFATAGRRYLVEYRLLPTAAQVIIVRFRIHAI